MKYYKAMLKSEALVSIMLFDKEGWKVRAGKAS